MNQSQTIPASNRSTFPWHWRKLLLCHVLLAVLIGSFFWAPTHTVWEWIDSGTFHFLNGSLKDRPNWQVFWALANHNLADWVTDVFFLSFFIAAVFSFPKEERLRRCAQILFCCIYCACIIYFVNRLLFRKHFPISHPSPTIVFPESIKLSREITWLKIKDAAKQSFPGDHGTTAILFAASYASLATRRLKILGWAYGIFLCLPRMVTGAHWLSDIVLGSGSIATFCLSWAFYTPLCAHCTDFFHRGFCLVKSLAKKLSPLRTGS